jgi:hypothetical protein
MITDLSANSGWSVSLRISSQLNSLSAAAGLWLGDQWE